MTEKERDEFWASTDGATRLAQEAIAALQDVTERRRRLFENEALTVLAVQADRPNDGRSGRCGIRLSGSVWCTLDHGHTGVHDNPTPVERLIARNAELHCEKSAAEATLAAVREFLENAQSYLYDQDDIESTPLHAIGHARTEVRAALALLTRPAPGKEGT